MQLPKEKATRSNSATFNESSKSKTRPPTTSSEKPSLGLADAPKPGSAIQTLIKTLWSPAVVTSTLDTGKNTLDAFDTIKWVCKLRYPPTVPSTDKAYDATLLFYVKDRLNSLAYPATGLTIAYTYIFVEEQRPLQHATKDERDSQTRASVAREAYPGLVGSAKRFRWVHKLYTGVGVFVTLLAAILLWLVTYGVQITSRFEEDGKRATEITRTIYAEIDKENAAVPLETVTAWGVPTNSDSASSKDLIRGPIVSQPDSRQAITACTSCSGISMSVSGTRQSLIVRPPQRAR